MTSQATRIANGTLRNVALLIASPFQEIKKCLPANRVFYIRPKLKRKAHGLLWVHQRHGGSPVGAVVRPIPKGPTDSHVPVV
jgi:hypothetical protein